MPFGGIERKPGEIAWPPEFATVMSTLGLRQAYSRALPITIAKGRSVPFVSPAALMLLKLIAWSERGSAVDRRDARDLGLLLKTYLRAGNEERLYGEHVALLDEPDFDYDAAGARILGRDLAGVAGREARARLASARLRSSCSKALAMRWISADRAPTALAVSRKVAVTVATSLMRTRALGSVSPKNCEADSNRSSEQVPSSRSMFVVSTRALRSVGTGLRS